MEKTWKKTLLFLWIGPLTIGTLSRIGEPTTGGAGGREDFVGLYLVGRLGGFCCLVSLLIGWIKGDMSNWSSFQSVLMAVFTLTTFALAANIWGPFFSFYEKYITFWMLLEGKSYDEIMDHFMGKRIKEND